MGEILTFNARLAEGYSDLASLIRSIFVFVLVSYKIQRKMLDSVSLPIRKSTLLKSDVGLLLIIAASLFIASLA